jgi:methylenetetrahydrofolate dehydrogenase (NADP+)/methenyltetrahydrofolate cyclohydrolase
MKARWAEQAGIAFRLVNLDEGAGGGAVLARLAELNDDPEVDGILVELPLPQGYDRLAIQEAIHQHKDVDGVTTDAAGRLLIGAAGPRPATAVAILELLTEGGVPLSGRRAVVIGRSVVVGKPAALLLLAADATVTIAHSRTTDLAAVTSQAEVLVVAAGSPGLVRAAHVQPGAAVIDAGTTWVDSPGGGGLVGDVAFDEVVEIAGLLTPVPGGVGPVTTAVVLRNVVELAESHAIRATSVASRQTSSSP